MNKVAPHKWVTMRINDKEYTVVDKYMYSSHDLIGVGAFGQVYHGYTVPGQEKAMEVAMKIIMLPEGSHDDEEMKIMLTTTRQEILILKKIRHPNIVRLLDIKKIGSYIFLIMEFCAQKDLNHFAAKTQLNRTGNPLIILAAS